MTANPQPKKRRSRGAAMVEYSLVLLLVLVAAVPGVGGVGIEISRAWCSVKVAIDHPEANVGPYRNFSDNRGHCYTTPSHRSYEIIW